MFVFSFMPSINFEHHTQFFTPTIFQWKHLLKDDAYWTEEVFIQKLNYIHNNPISHPWNLVQYPEDDKYSSAKFYETDVDEFGLLTHYKD